MSHYSDVHPGCVDVGYNAYIWDHLADCWEWTGYSSNRWGLRAILKRLRRHWEDWAFLIVHGTATEQGYLAREKWEVA